MVDETKRSGTVVAGLVAMGAVFLVFLPSLFAGFLMLDDPAYVSNNALVLQGLNWESVSWVWTHVYESMWAPLLWMSYMLDSSVFGTSAWGYHLTNVLLHVANTVLLYVLLVRTTKAVKLALICALLFGVHPLRVESVVWITERKDVLSAFFWLAACNVYVGYVRHRSVLRYVLVALLFVAGLLVKPMLVTLPVVFLLLDFWPLMRWSFYGGDQNVPIWKLVMEKAPLLLFSVVFSVIAVFAHAQGEGLPGGALSMPWMRVPVNLTFYLQKSLLPLGLSVVYPRVTLLSPVMVTVWAGVLIIISVLAIHSAKKMPYFLMGWLWFLVSILPVSGVVPFGIVDYADRFSYIPMIGPVIALVWMVSGFVRNRGERILVGVVAGAAIILLAVLTIMQIQRWENTERILTYGLEQEPDSERMINCLAYDRMQRGEYAGAEELFLHGLELHPENVGMGLNYVELLRKTDRHDEAHERLEALNEISPENYAVVGSLGVSAMLDERLEEALQLLGQSLTLNPEQEDMLYNQGRTHQKLGRPELAEETYERVLLLNPKNVKAHQRLLDLAVERKDGAMALPHVDALLNADPTNEQLLKMKAFFESTMAK